MWRGESTFGVRLPEEVRAAKEAGGPPYRGRGQPPKERAAPVYTAEELIGSVPQKKRGKRSFGGREPRVP